MVQTQNRGTYSFMLGLHVICLLWVPRCPSMEVRIPASQRGKVREAFFNQNVKVLPDQVHANCRSDERRRKEVKRSGRGTKGKYVLGSFRDVTFSSSVCC